jgi:hypothetical protein
VSAAGARENCISLPILSVRAEVHEMQEKDGRDFVMFDEGQRFAEMGNWDSIHELGAMY